jgi:hypothetical protein
MLKYSTIFLFARSKFCQGKYWIFNKLINYSTNICWSCQNTIVAHCVFTTTSIDEGRLFVYFVLMRSRGCFKSCSRGGGLHGLGVQKLLNTEGFLHWKLN